MPDKISVNDNKFMSAHSIFYLIVNKFELTSLSTGTSTISKFISKFILIYFYLTIILFMIYFSFEEKV